MILLGDQPVAPGFIDRLVDGWLAGGTEVVATRRDGVLQPPLLLARQLWPEVERLRGDVGLRAVIRSRAERVRVVDADPAGEDTADIDTPQDLDRARDR